MNKEIKPQYNSKGIFAFTLAEVLVTLGVIGVIAAMTLPSLINSYQERVTVTKVKKFYSVINQSLLFAIKDNGTVDEWNYIEADPDTQTGGSKPDKLAAILIKPYTKISKDCGTKGNCIYNGYYKLLNGKQHTMNYNNDGQYYQFILADGTFMWLRGNAIVWRSSNCSVSDGGYDNTCGNIFIDVNGKNPPNTIGRDTFAFIILKNKIAPSKRDDCNPKSAGWGCSEYILRNGDMKYLHK